MTKREFTVQNAHTYNHSGAIRWMLSHLWKHRLFVFIALLLGIISNIAYALVPVYIGQAIDVVTQPNALENLTRLALIILGLLVFDGATQLGFSLSIETLAQRLQAGTREELYRSLLGKSQTFHDRQRVGDIMAMATDDTMQLNMMINPGILFIFNSIAGIVMPMVLIAAMRFELLLVPTIFIIAYLIALYFYGEELSPVANNQRAQFAKTNAALEETISGIEVVKASSEEDFERNKFRANVRKFRDYFVDQGNIEARYLPILFFGISLGLAFLHGLFLYLDGTLEIGELIGFMGLFGLLRFPTFSTIFSISLIQLGIASATRILNLIRTETELDQNAGGFAQPIKGDIVFENVSFSFDNNPVLENLSFHLRPGATIAVVGQTGSGKSTLTQLINRTYDVTSGRILVDGVDVREWDLNALRSQISNIEQDIFLFSRNLADNIAFGAPNATREQIENVAKEAQAHNFIMTFKDGYDTVVGERGVTLSGGQRQRIALARAFLSNPRILILDDSTSAIDSATEDEIQKAINRAQEGRTTILITHRLSQIRWADHILVLDRGRVVASGNHEQLLRSSQPYRRIFARYDMDLPPLEPNNQPA